MCVCQALQVPRADASESPRKRLSAAPSTPCPTQAPSRTFDVCRLATPPVTSAGPNTSAASLVLVLPQVYYDYAVTAETALVRRADV